MSTTVQSKSTASATGVANARPETAAENQEEENRSGHGDDLACARDDEDDETTDELRDLMNGFAETYRSFS